MRSIRRGGLVGCWIVCGAALAASTGCIDLRDFEGQWTGDIIREPEVRQGFSEDARVDPLELSNITIQRLSARLTTTDDKFADTPLNRITRAANDALGSLSFEGDPLRNYLLLGELQAEPLQTPAGSVSVDGGPAPIIVSLFSDDHVELRVLRGNDLFGLFYLQRAE